MKKSATRAPKSDPRWTPVRKGKIYCSPGCGLGCTHKSFLKVTSATEALVEELQRGTHSTAWRARVWDNLGWYGTAALDVKGLDVTVSQSVGDHSEFLRSYACLINGCGRSIYTSHETPLGAYQSAIASLREQICTLVNALSILPSVGDQ